VNQFRSGQFQDGSGFGTGVQAPMVPGSAHELHGPSQGVAQQAPWAQTRVLHSSLIVQGTPSPPARQMPFMHFPIAQSVSSTHADAQRVPVASHLNGAHEIIASGTQLPPPLQLDAGE
jgi:hypothetical protein